MFSSYLVNVEVTIHINIFKIDYIFYQFYYQTTSTEIKYKKLTFLHKSYSIHVNYDYAIPLISVYYIKSSNTY